MPVFLQNGGKLYENKITAPGRNWKSNLTMAVAFEGDYDLEKAKESAARERTEEEKREDARNRCLRHIF